MRKTSEKGLELIKQFEGYRNKAYKCAAGVWTIGWGTTRINGKAVTSTMTCTESQALSWLKVDCSKYEAKVNKYDNKYNWNQNEFDAMVSFAYNIGSIDHLTANGTRSKAVIVNKMLEYNKASGKVLPGLTTRRKAERKLFLEPVQNIQVTSTNHVPLNYQIGEQYKVTCDSLRIRTKKASQNESYIPSGTQIGSLKNGQTVTCYAAASVNGQIWIYIGEDARHREQWVCADTGDKTYIN